MGDGPDRRLRLAHLTTVDMSLALLLGAELREDVDAGFEVLGISAPGPYVAAVEALGVTHVPVPALTRAWSPRSDARAARQFWRLLCRLDLDVLHTHTPKAGILGRILGRAAGVPVVVDTCHGLWIAAGDPRAGRAAVLAVEGLASRFAHFELYQNGEDRRALRRAVPDARARVVGNGVDLDRFRFDEEARRAVRAELGIGPGELLVGGVGRRVAEKGIAELAAAARSLAGSARFVWAGPADLEEEPPAAGLTFLGERADMAALYSALDVFALPSHREGFSRSAMEAAACGRAMVLSDIRGCREIGEHDRHLLLVPRGDAGALTAALARLLADPALRARLGRAARQRAHEEFDQRRVARASLEAYRPGGRPPAARVARAVRRAVDVAVAAAAGVVLSPLLAAVAVAVRLTTGRPVLFRQQRSGRHGQEFSIVKFRTMRAARYESGPDADRLTPVGRLLRRTSLDELPQLWNVLKGELSLVGPRPTLPEQVAHYSAHQRRRLEVRPGITGWAQVTGRNAITWPERIELDVWYVDNRSVALDLRILVLTLRNLARREGITGPGGVNQGFPLPEPSDDE